MFDIQQRGSTVWREVLGGLTTFMAMSYIIFVQVHVLAGPAVGMDAGGVIMATCLAAAVGSVLMGLMANYPIGLAPGMGENFFFAFTLIPAMAGWATGVVEWKIALALTATTGLVFLLLSFVGFRSYLLNSIPKSLSGGIAAGIGLFVSLLGFSNGNLISAGGGLIEFAGFVTGQGQAAALNVVGLLTLGGLLVTLVLWALRVPGSVLIAILVNAAAAMALGLVPLPETAAGLPSGLGQTAGGAIEGFVGLGRVLASEHVVEMLILLLVLLMMDVFDTVGTLVGVSSQAGLMVDDKLPRAERALGADALATVAGAGLGTTTVTAYIESVTGVAVGARTGLAAIVAGACFVLAMFFQPIIALIGGGVMVDGAARNPMIAPAMIFVGAMMLQSIRKIDWDDVTEYLPAFLSLVVMPLTMSISHGIAAGFVAYALGKLLTGRGRSVSAMVFVVAGAFVIRYGLWVAFRLGMIVL
jgi:adenine/guanine/hypoxanthine permease